jgi:hypothetical protein
VRDARGEDDGESDVDEREQGEAVRRTGRGPTRSASTPTSGAATAHTNGRQNTSRPVTETDSPTTPGQVQRNGHEHRGERGLLHEHPVGAAQPPDLDEQPRVDERRASAAAR